MKRLLATVRTRGSLFIERCANRLFHQPLQNIEGDAIRKDALEYLVKTKVSQPKTSHTLTKFETLWQE